MLSSSALASEPAADAVPGVQDTPKPDKIHTAIIPDRLSPPSLTAKSAIVVELNSGMVLYGKNEDEPRPMASLTKIMTTLLALEYGNLGDEVTASASALSELERFEDWGSNTGMAEGETMTLRDLLYCIMVASANEACNVVAEKVSGSVQAFVGLMNRRAAQLGCTGASFTNTHGLHEDNHYASARDIYLITLEAMKHPEFMEMANTASKSIPPTNKSGERALYTTNHLISKRTYTKYDYHLAEGIKTGHHSKAGYCLTSSAQSEGLRLMTVVMGCEYIDDTFMSFVETRELIEWSFESYAFKRILNASDPTAMLAVPIQMGDGFDAVNVKPSTSFTALIPKILDVETITRKTEIFDEGEIQAPISKGQILGEMTLAYRGHEFGVVPLITDFEVKRNESEYIRDIAKDFLARPELWYAIYGAAGLIVLYIIIVIVYNLYRRRNRIPGNYRGKKRRRRR
ncbi:MAG: D-alanyl-D-alanine carboxypeptidase [Oscillospiraceae bacterium]|nr:D-alanyl-D-alanine carboxypeptidase [Oscillospiraceae bacterium]